MFVPTMTDAVTPTDTEAQIARASSKALAPLLNAEGTGRAQLHFSTESGQETDVSLPLPAARLLFHALQEMAKGNAVTLLPIDAELTIQQAAELMRVSQSSLITLLDEKKYPAARSGRSGAFGMRTWRFT